MKHFFSSSFKVLFGEDMEWGGWLHSRRGGLMEGGWLVDWFDRVWVEQSCREEENQHISIDSAMVQSMDWLRG